MPQRAPTSSSLMRPFVVLALPGMYLLYKYNQYRQQQMETARRRVTERELMHLNTKIYSAFNPLVKSNFAKDMIIFRELFLPNPAPFRRLEFKPKVCPTKEEPPPKALPPPKKKLPPMPAPRPGVQVSILGADTAIGQYVALLLKQCSCIKKLRLYEAKDSQGCNRDLCSVVQDLQHINTNCLVQAFSCACYELERCLQNTDIVLMLESGYLNVDMPFEKRFQYQAPIVKCYADAIANECPKAFIIVCATPIDCMVPLIAETLKETGWYDSRKLLGSLAVPEMRASTLAARALCLEPRYTRVPCVGGTEGESLVPLFSKAVEYFDFAKHNAMMMTDAVRNAPVAVARCDGPCIRAGDLSEAHALAGLVTAVAHALLCKDIPRVTGFVETDLGQVISPARYIANSVDIGGSGIVKNIGLPKMSESETTMVNIALNELGYKQRLVEDWYCKYCSSSNRFDACQYHFFTPRPYERYLATDVLLNHKGVCKKLGIPGKLNSLELELLDAALGEVENNIKMSEDWYKAVIKTEFIQGQMTSKKVFQKPRHYDRLDECAKYLQ